MTHFLDHLIHHHPKEQNVTTRTMYDSTTPAAIPAGAQMVAAYIDGKYAWSAEELARFPDATKLGITVTGNEVTDIIDVETGDATPAHVPGWITDTKRVEHPHRATVYCNRSSLGAVKAACQGAGFTLGHDYVLWVATLDGTTELADMHGVVAIQDKSAAMLGFHADSSVVVDDTWHGDAKPVPPPSPAPPVPPEEKTELAQIQAKAVQIGQLVNEIHALASQ